MAKMRLLIITQKIDRDDPVLGFFLNWVCKFAQYCRQVIVICLEKGKYDLPANVKVLSLGKEKYFSYPHIFRRLIAVFRFYKYIWQKRKDYDAVFVHMNPEYVVLAGLLWRILGKRLGLWYIHKSLTWKLKLAEKIVEKIFTASEGSSKLKSKKLKFVGHGIDTDFFRQDKQRFFKKPRSLLYLGRIAPIKNIDTLIKAAKLLDKEGVDFRLDIVGEPGEKDGGYFEEIKKLAKPLEEKSKIRFLGKVPNWKAPALYNQYEVLVNLTPLGSFDKVILEAMACGCLILVSNELFQNILPENFIFEENNSEDLARKIESVFRLTEREKEKYSKEFREYVVKNHNLERLIKKIIDLIKY